MIWSDIPGWTDFTDLYDREVERAKDGACFVEVGVWRGRSLAYMADAIRKSGKLIFLYGVDRFTGDAECGPVTIGQVESNLAACGVSDVAMLIESDSAAAAADFNACDFVFIDAAHDYESVKRDIAAWTPKVKPGGVIAGHDRGMEGVARAVREAFGNRVRTIGPLAWWVQL
jgi:predicted O-methyltransferase YrrM